MLHIYRQVTGLVRTRTFILTKTRENEEAFPFDDVVVLPRPRIHFLLRFYKKYLARMEPVFYRGEYDQLAGALAGREADLLHVYFGHTGVHLLPFLRNWPKPALVSFHGMDIMQRDREPGYNGRLQELLRVVPMVLARSESLAARLVELGCNASKIRINRTGIPMDAYPQAERKWPEDGAWRLVQASRFIEKKGLPDALEAFAGFREKFPKSRFVLAGEGPMKEAIQVRARELGLGDSLEFAGFLDAPRLAALYARSHLFLHPSVTTAAGDREGIPNSLLEAMATGLPVVATTHGGIPEAVDSGTEGLLVPEHSPQHLTQAMISLASDPSRWLAMSAASADNVRKKFEASRSIALLEGFYDELLSLGASGAGKTGS